jgi:branched-chain amino acid transport system substrate-binding protein
MTKFSRRRFLQLTAETGGALVFGDLIDQQVLGLTGRSRTAAAGEPIKIGMLDPLSSPYKTSSIYDVHGANAAVDLFNKKGGVLGRPVTILEADDASNLETVLKAAAKFIKEDLVDVLMGTFNGACALAVSAQEQKEYKLLMVTGAYLPELTGVASNARTFVFMPKARMMAQSSGHTLQRPMGLTGT